ncbi:MAG: L-serine ammonia-lyase, iron-sulfur-dependent subunit beta [Atribacterota bacterium]|nr:L-serine ammonia-lyase, iron-sulfur-dependent subunit beta [Atribacterota bacterium]
MSLLEIIGPVMIGPSSSHTAGAVRLGNIARRLWGKEVTDVTIYLRGSFASTYWGHGTDKALVGGLLGLKPDDSRIRESLVLAHRANVNYKFEKETIDGAHPNSVRFVIKSEEKNMEMVGASIGGGAIQIQEIEGFPVEIDGDLSAFIIFHQDKKGVVASIATALFQKNLNIAEMKLKRKSRGKDAILVIEVDSQENQDDIFNNLEISKNLYSKIIFLPVERE